MKLIYAEDAAADLDNIVQFGILRWGEDQADRYVGRLLETAERLCTYPKLGRPFTIGNEACRRIGSGSHVIYYRQEDDNFVIGRILHASQDAERHFR